MSRGKRAAVPTESQQAIAQGFSDRLFERWMAYQGEQRKRLHHEDLAELVATALGVKAVPAISTVSRWFKRSVPDLATIAALGRVLGCDPGWLGFGELTTAVGPADYVAEARRADAK